VPAGMVRPRASQAPRLSPAVKALYAAAGWHLTDGGNLDHGQWSGPCAACHHPCARYGPHGRPLCPTCRKDTPA
jgi:hypothetical protein